MKRHVLAVCAMLALASSSAHALSFGHIAFVSSTLGNNSNRLCMGVPSTLHPDDLGCPTYSPYLTSGGLLGVGTATPTTALEVSGTISATSLIVNGMPITGGNGDIITSGTTAVRVNSATATISFTTNGSVANYFNSAGDLIAHGISLTTSPLSATAVRATTLSATVGTIDSLGAGSFQAANISGTLIQPGAAAAACVVGINGAIRYNSTSNTIDVCLGTSWTSLASGTTSALGDIITSGTTAVRVNSATATISFTTNGSVANYFNSAGDLIAHGISLTTSPLSATAVRATTLSATVRTIDSLGAGNLKTTNLSATMVDATQGGTVSATYGYFGSISGSGAGLYNILARAVTGLANDRISSGTTSVIANQNTGVSISTPLEVSGSIRPVGSGFVPCDAAHEGAAQFDVTTHALLVCLP